MSSEVIVAAKRPRSEIASCLLNENDEAVDQFDILEKVKRVKKEKKEKKSKDEEDKPEKKFIPSNSPLYTHTIYFD